MTDTSDVRENDQVQAQENGDVDGSANDETQALVDQRAEYVHDPETMGRDYRVEGNDVRDYIGVDPEYMTYANATEAPGLTDVERFNYTTQYDHLEGNADDAQVDDGPANPDVDPATAPETQDGDVDPASDEYDPKVNVHELSDDEINSLVYKDEDADGRDDDTGLNEDEFRRLQASARERLDNPPVEVKDDSLGFPQ